jgi:hypothetical protein
MALSCDIHRLIHGLFGYGWVLLGSPEITVEMREHLDSVTTAGSRATTRSSVVLAGHEKQFHLLMLMGCRKASKLYPPSFQTMSRTIICVPKRAHGSSIGGLERGGIENQASFNYGMPTAGFMITCNQRI